MLSNDIGELKAAILSLKSEIMNRRSEPVNETVFEELLSELDDRNNRKQNIILYNVSEPDANSHDQRKQQDLQSARSILGNISSSVDLDNINVLRLGRYTDDATERKRPLRVRLNNVKDVHVLIKRAKNLVNTVAFANIKVSLDKTFRQRAYFNKMKEELRERTRQGESGLAIKYERGIPTIRALN